MENLRQGDTRTLRVELSITGIQAMRSSLAGNILVEVPDLRRPGVRRAHAADDWFPDLAEL